MLDAPLSRVLDELWLAFAVPGMRLTRAPASKQIVVMFVESNVIFIAIRYRLFREKMPRRKAGPTGCEPSGGLGAHRVTAAELR